MLTQEQERAQLLQLLGGITLQDLQEKHPVVHPGKGDAASSTGCCFSCFLVFPTQHICTFFHADDLRSGCVEKLREIYADLLAQKDGGPSSWPRPERQVALCSLQLLEELMELQEVQASALMHKVSQGSRSVSSAALPKTAMHGCSVFVP